MSRGTLAAAFPGWMRVPRDAPAHVEAGLLGRKAGKGFYRYGRAARTRRRIPRPRRCVRRRNCALTDDELQRGMVLLMVNEAARCLEEKIVEGAGDIDFAMVMGTGFAPFRGGPLRYADSARHGESRAAQLPRWPTGRRTFEPCALLAEMARHDGNDSMKTETPPTEEHTASPSVIDTSKMSPEQRAALELTEAAREAQGASFAGGLFMGRFDFDALHPYPVQRAEDHDQGDAFLASARRFPAGASRSG